MPIQSKANWARLRVGVFAIVSMIILSVLIFFITGNLHLFEPNRDVFTYMDDSAALVDGASVRLNGIVVGKVKKISLSGSKEPRRIVRIDMNIQEKMLSQIPVDSMASISAANLLGDKFVNIKKGKLQATVQPGAELPSLDTREFDEVIQQGYALLSELHGIILRVDRIVGLVENGQGSIGKLLVDETLYNKVISIVDEAHKLAASLNSTQGTMGKLIHDDALYNQVRGSVNRIDVLLQGIQEGQGTAGKLLKDPALYDEVQKTVADVHLLVNDLNAGKGTAGKLLKSDELHNQVSQTIARIDTIIDHINAGQGTVGQLLVNQQLYDNLNGATRELHELFKDFRANPKKFLRIKLSLF